MIKDRSPLILTGFFWGDFVCVGDAGGHQGEVKGTIAVDLMPNSYRLVVWPGWWPF